MQNQITYNDLATREDRQFHVRCRRELGKQHYIRLVPMVKLAFQEGMKEPNPNKRENTARRMANLVFTMALGNFNYGK